jgi:Cu+-exporting ATPase
MFGFNKNNRPEGEKLILKIDGMHCTSCSLTIDNQLEDLTGVNQASTNFAKSMCNITYDPTIISVETIKQTIKELGYSVIPNNS